MHAVAILRELQQRAAFDFEPGAALRITPAGALDDELRGIIRESKAELLACAGGALETSPRQTSIYPRDVYDSAAARDFALNALGLTEFQRAALLAYAAQTDLTEGSYQ
jgi:hypothetical protein